MTKAKLSWKPLTFILALFLSAALLFSLQPMVGKILLPVFGGTAAVWNTCLVAYQLIYLAGCLWVYALTRWASPRTQLVLHFTALLLAFLVLPPSRLSTIALLAPTNANPVPWLLKNLFVVIGVPLFVTSATSSLLQTWFTRTRHHRSKDPYYLSTASNAGSLIALLSYPFLLEAHFGIRQQAIGWTICYGALVLLIGVCAFLTNEGHKGDEETVLNSTSQFQAAVKPNSAARLSWVWFSFLPSTLLSGTTFYLSEFISVTPLLWIGPLFLYLLSLIFAFSSKAPKYAKNLIAVAAMTTVPWIYTAGEDDNAIWLLLSLHLLSFFLIALALHCRLVGRRPSTKYLSEFYVWMAVGGAAGGLFNGLVAPMIFSRALEYPLAILATAVTLTFVLKPLNHFAAWTTGALVPLLFVFKLAPFGPQVVPVFFERNFYGITKVLESGEHDRFLIHNSVMQSKQSGTLPARREPYANYGRESGIGILLNELNKSTPPPNVAVIGLGAGVLAAYAQTGSFWNYYELNPSIVKAVIENKLFSYIQDSASKNISVTLGDARRMIDGAKNHFFDLIVIDAFNSASMPVHLITKEAFALYFQKALPDGIVALNNASQLFDLGHVVCRIAEESGWACVTGKEQEWVFVSKNPSQLAVLQRHSGWELVSSRIGGPVWTDEYSDPTGVIQWPQLRKAKAWVRKLAGKKD